MPRNRSSGPRHQVTPSSVVVRFPGVLGCTTIDRKGRAHHIIFCPFVFPLNFVVAESPATKSHRCRSLPLSYAPHLQSPHPTDCLPLQRPMSEAIRGRTMGHAGAEVYPLLCQGRGLLKKMVNLPANNLEVSQQPPSPPSPLAEQH